MKLYAKGALALICLVTLLFSAGCRQNTPALNVNEVSADPGAYVGSITLTGVTGAFSKFDPSLFGLMDVKELQCTSTTCNKQYIPIRVQGTVPSLGDEVLVTGAFTKAQNGYIFVAEAVKVVRNHKLGS